MVLGSLARQRPRWSSRYHFNMYIIALVFSPATLWKFPIFWFRHGVALFLPYVASLLTVGVPLVCLELSLGHFMQRGGPNAWGVVPLSKGLGVTSMLITFIKSSINLYWAAVSGYYLYLILTNHLPDCLIESKWPRPLPSEASVGNGTLMSYISTDPNRTTTGVYDDDDLEAEIHHHHPPNNHNLICLQVYSKFWRNQVLETSEAVTSPGAAVLQIFLATAIVSLVCYCLVLREMRWSGKVMSILAPLPLVGFLSIIGWTASSGWDFGSGVYHLLTLNFETLTQPQTWFSSVQLMVVTIGLGLNVLPSLASYNRPTNYTTRDAIVVCILSASANVFVSLFFLGLLGSKVGGLVTEDNDLSFLLISVPAAFLGFSHPMIASSLFCVFVVIIIINSTVVYLESLVTSLVDLSQHILRRWRALLVTGATAASFLLTIAMSTQGGVYVSRLFERVTDGGFLVLVICVMECLLVGIVYGGGRFYDNIEAMTGKRPHWWIKFCWACLSPLILLATLVHQEYHSALYVLDLGTGNSDLAKVLVISAVTALLTPIPLVAVWVWHQKIGTCIKRIHSSLRPELKPHQIPIKWRLEGRWVKFTDRL